MGSFLYIRLNVHTQRSGCEADPLTFIFRWTVNLNNNSFQGHMYILHLQISFFFFDNKFVVLWKMLLWLFEGFLWIALKLEAADLWSLRWEGLLHNPCFWFPLLCLHENQLQLCPVKSKFPWLYIFFLYCWKVEWCSQPSLFFYFLYFI